MLAVLKTNKDGLAESFFGFANPGGWAVLPDGSSMSPAEDGMRGDGYEISDILPADPVPDGFYANGGRSISLKGGSPKWVQELSPSIASMPELSSRQFWLAAKQAGVTKAQLLAKVWASNREEDAELIELEINETIYFKRDYPLVAELAKSVGLSEVELDHLWTWAASI